MMPLAQLVMAGSELVAFMEDHERAAFMRLNEIVKHNDLARTVGAPGDDVEAIEDATCRLEMEKELEHA